jgi:hypothetical protein
MQSAHFDGFVFKAFLYDIAVGDYGLASKCVFELFGWDRLVAGVNDWEKQGRFYCGCLSFEFADSAKQVIFFNFEAQEDKPTDDA